MTHRFREKFWGIEEDVLHWKLSQTWKKTNDYVSWTWCKRQQQKQPHWRADEGSVCAWKFAVYEAVGCLVIWRRLNFCCIIWLVPEFYDLGVEQEIFLQISSFLFVVNEKQSFCDEWTWLFRLKENNSEQYTTVSPHSL